MFVEYPFASILQDLTAKVRAREAGDDIQLEENNNSSKSVKEAADNERDKHCSQDGKGSNESECNSAQSTPSRVRKRSVSFVTRKSEERIIGGNIDVPTSIVDNE